MMGLPDYRKTKKNAPSVLLLALVTSAFKGSTPYAGNFPTVDVFHWTNL